MGPDKIVVAYWWADQWVRYGSAERGCGFAAFTAPDPYPLIEITNKPQEAVL